MNVSPGVSEKSATSTFDPLAVSMVLAPDEDVPMADAQVGETMPMDLGKASHRSLVDCVNLISASHVIRRLLMLL